MCEDRDREVERCKIRMAESKNARERKAAQRDMAKAAQKKEVAAQQLKSLLTHLHGRCPNIHTPTPDGWGDEQAREQQWRIQCEQVAKKANSAAQRHEEREIMVAEQTYRALLRKAEKAGVSTTAQSRVLRGPEHLLGSPMEEIQAAWEDVKEQRERMEQSHGTLMMDDWAFLIENLGNVMLGF